jgi:hypothetical protein
MKRILTAAITAFLAACALLPASAAVNTAQYYEIAAVRTQTPPPLDDPLAAAWTTGARVTLDHDVTYRKGVGPDTTEVYELVDGHFLYLDFLARQQEPIVAQQHTNETGAGNDDVVGVSIFPNGRNGFTYGFSANAIGTHQEYSSENTAFAPAWQSYGRAYPSGYGVTMRIPLDALKSSGGADWQINFYRYVSKTGLNAVWSYSPLSQGGGDGLYAGTLGGIGTLVPRVATRPQPRLQLYALAQAGGNGAGGSTSRLGGDVSIPVGSTTSIFGTVHPDYSEVERDQQTIAPTEFRRIYQEVRPFFTQGANFYNPSGQEDLYTPSIPTPRYGYAVEGANGGFKYAGFNAAGIARDDNAQALSYTTNDTKFNATFQRVGVTHPGFSDVTQTGSVLVGNAKNFDAYAEYGEDRGSNVFDPSLGNYRDVGVNFYGPTQGITANLESYGALYSPVDGYVAHSDTAGYNLFGYKNLNYSARSQIQSVNLYGSFDRYHDHTGALDQSDQLLSVSVNNRRQNGVYLTTSSSYVLFGRYGMVPFNQNTVEVYDAANPARTASIYETFGHFYDGYLNTFSTYASLKLLRRGTLSLTHYQSMFRSDAAGSGMQTLDRASFTYEFSRYGSFALGVRVIDGVAPGFAPLSAPQRGTNLSFALNARFSRARLYAVYGDPNAFSTFPAFIVKLVRFIGADEGT